MVEFNMTVTSLEFGIKDMTVEARNAGEAVRKAVRQFHLGGKEPKPFSITCVPADYRSPAQH